MLICVLILVLYYVLTYIIGLVCLLKQNLTGRRKCSGLVLQTGKVAIVTGGGAGIGFFVSKGLVAKNVHVIIGGKCEETGRNAIKEIRKDFPNAKVDFIKLDLMSLKSVREFVEEFLSRNLPLNILVNNAGVMFPPYEETENGYESQLQVNYLAHFYLTQLLLDKLVESGTPGAWSRVINVSSYMHFIGWPNLENLNRKATHWYNYSCHKGYADSKLLIIASTNRLDRKLREDGVPVSVCSLHPGVVSSDLWRHVSAIHRIPIKLIEKYTHLSTEEGAETTLYAAMSPEVEGQSGCYYDNCQVTEAASLTYNEEFQEELWTKSLLMIENAVNN